MRHLLKNFKNAFSRPTFSVCFFTALPFKTNTFPRQPGNPPTPPPLLPASLNQRRSSCQPLIMFSAHFLSLARLHLSLKIHNCSCDHGTSPRIPLSTSGRHRGDGGGPLRQYGYETSLKRVGRRDSFHQHGLSTQTGCTGGVSQNTETVDRNN